MNWDPILGIILGAALFGLVREFFNLRGGTMKAYTATYEGKDGKGELNMTVGGDNFTQAARKAENVANELERGELISLVLTDDVIL